MRKNERLIGIRPYQTSTGDWHLELTYAYEDKKGEHHVIFPDVLCPFPMRAVPFPDTTPHAIGIYLRISRRRGTGPLQETCNEKGAKS